MLTIFTPVFNRAHLIPRLYESLLRQTSFDFEWLVVDDGSEDELEPLMNELLATEKFCVRFYKKKNGGKHTAINYGVSLARGEFFFIVDSDDYLERTAVEKILFFYRQIEADPSFAGVCGIKASFSGQKICGEVGWATLDCSSIDFRHKFLIQGDVAEAYRTEILKQYPFPSFPGENFLTESIVWNRIAKSYKLRFFNEIVYYAEYLPDGLSQKKNAIYFRSPKGAMLSCIESLGIKELSLELRFKLTVFYWRLFFFTDRKFFMCCKEAGWLSLFWVPIALLFYIFVDRKWRS